MYQASEIAKTLMAFLIHKKLQTWPELNMILGFHHDPCNAEGFWVFQPELVPPASSIFSVRGICSYFRHKCNGSIQ
jgi:hypothetical protein